jgi:hypothetical protein
MPSEPSFFLKNLNFKSLDVRMVFVIFIAAFLARGSAIYPGFAVDDYRFYSKVDVADYSIYLAQGRYINALTVWVINSFGASISGVYFSLGISALFLQSIFTFSILRFVGLAHLPMAGLMGAIINTHPYLAEIYTFRMALPGLCMALIFSIAALELVALRKPTLRTKLLAFFAVLLMLLTYQVFLNYFAVVIIFAFVVSQTTHGTNIKPFLEAKIYRTRAFTLSLLTLASAAVFFALLKLSILFGSIALEGRTKLIAFDTYPERLLEVTNGIVKIYWAPEPVISEWLKILIAILLLVAIAEILNSQFRRKADQPDYMGMIGILVSFLLLVPASIGIIMFFDNWWPVPRVISHVAVIIGLLFLLADYCGERSSYHYLRSSISVARIIVLVGFVLLSNQIFADQNRVNQTDRMLANRIVARLETQSDIGKVQFVFVDGGSWGYPSPIRTVQGDMNISAFFPSYSKVPLLAEVSGYNFQTATGDNARLAKNYCETKLPWPSSESVKVTNDLAIICLSK